MTSTKLDHITDYTVQHNELQSEMLRTPLFDVNMRLYTTNSEYKHIIQNIISYMMFLITTGFKDYTAIKGISGANVGIPFNIIIVDARKAKKDYLVMINPRVKKLIGDTKVVKSNCGSILLNEPIEVERHKKVSVSYFTAEAEPMIETFEGALASTIQHEIDHNNGFTILDRKHIKK